MRNRIFLFFAFACCASQAAAQSEATLERIAREALTEMQALSFQAKREYCAIFALNEADEIIVSKFRRGWRASCRPRDPRGAVHILASMHTHGVHSERYDSEMPSTNDMLGDMEEGIFGYIATPGGRFWRLDGLNGTGQLICGVGCLPSDPAYNPADHDPIPQRVTLDTLYEREE